MTDNIARRPAGTPDGGQFAATSRAEAPVSLAPDARKARQAEYARYAMAAESMANQLLEDARHAELRNIADDLRDEFAEAVAFEFTIDEDGGILVTRVEDADGNELDPHSDLDESPRYYAQELFSSFEPEDMAAFADITHNLEELIAWEPEGGLQAVAA